MANATIAEQSFLLNLGFVQSLVGRSKTLIANFRFDASTIELLNLQHDITLLLDSNFGYNEQRVIHMALMSCNLDMITSLAPGFDWRVENKNPLYYWDEKNNEVIVSQEYRLDLVKLHRLPLEKLKSLCVTKISQAEVESIDGQNHIYDKRTKLTHGE